MRVATWNVNSVVARTPRLLDWLATTGPDVVCLQETKCTDLQFPSGDIAALGYDVALHSEGRWNGVAIVSRVGLDDVVRGLPGEPVYERPEARAVAATCGGIRFVSVYVPNGREPGHAHFGYKLEWLAALRRGAAAEIARHRHVVVCGDMNVAPTDDDVWDPAAFAESTHVTPAEREALAGIRAEGLVDIIPRPLKYDRPFTYWDYRAGMFHKNMGMRIDLVYAAPTVAERVADAWIDRNARKGTGPSDHAPVVVDLRDP